MTAAKWLRPIVKSVDGERLAAHADVFPRSLRYWLVAWGPFLLLIERKK